jgi:hypothetical protein
MIRNEVFLELLRLVSSMSDKMDPNHIYSQHKDHVTCAMYVISLLNRLKVHEDMRRPDYKDLRAFTDKHIPYRDCYYNLDPE